MRLMLDVHISGRRIARALRERGHDVRAIDEERALDEIDDEAVLGLAAADGRIVVTANARDYLALASAWAEAVREHAGCIIVARSIRQHQFGAIIDGVLTALEIVPTQTDWHDRVHWLSRRD